MAAFYHWTAIPILLHNSAKLTHMRQTYMRTRAGIILSIALLIAQAQGALLQQPEQPPAKAAPTRQGKGLEGEWNGVLDVQGQKLRLVLKVKKSADGKLSGTIDSLDQSVNDIPITSVNQSGDDIKLELTGIAAIYEGKMNAAGSEISGKWKQGGASLPLIFQRSGAKAS